MTPAEALSVLAQMADRAMGNGADHRAVQEATQVLDALVNPPDPEPDDG